MSNPTATASTIILNPGEEFIHSSYFILTIAFGSFLFLMVVLACCKALNKDAFKPISDDAARVNAVAFQKSRHRNSSDSVVDEEGDNPFDAGETDPWRSLATELEIYQAVHINNRHQVEPAVSEDGDAGWTPGQMEGSQGRSTRNSIATHLHDTWTTSVNSESDAEGVGESYVEWPGAPDSFSRPSISNGSGRHHRNARTPPRHSGQSSVDSRRPIADQRRAQQSPRVTQSPKPKKYGAGGGQGPHGQDLSQDLTANWHDTRLPSSSSHSSSRPRGSSAGSNHPLLDSGWHSSSRPKSPKQMSPRAQRKQQKKQQKQARSPSKVALVPAAADRRYEFKNARNPSTSGRNNPVSVMDRVKSYQVQTVDSNIDLGVPYQSRDESTYDSSYLKQKRKFLASSYELDLPPPPNNL